MLFSGTANEELSKEVSKYLDQPLSQAKITRFSDGEINIKIQESVRGKDVFIIQSTSAPANANLMELLIMVDALNAHLLSLLQLLFLIMDMQDKIEKQSLEFQLQQNLLPILWKQQGLLEL